MNNFQELHAVKLKEMQKPPLDARKKILQRMGMYYLISDFIELYLPRQFDYLIDLLNTSEDDMPEIEEIENPDIQ